MGLVYRILGGKEMDLPEIGETITTERALELCKHLGLAHLVQRIDANPDLYGKWVFDGISVLNDKCVAAILGVDHAALTLECALPHDLRYGYGEPGNERERKEADLGLKSDLRTKAGMNRFWASVFYLAVRIGGAEALRLPFSWGFARRLRAG